MTYYEIVTPEEHHIRRIAEGMRQADRDEVWASHGHTPEEAVQWAVGVSRDTARAGLADGECYCIFGVGARSYFSFEGHPWMLSHDDIEKHTKNFLRGSIQWIDEIKWDYRVLCNLVDARNTVSKRWLKWLGFTIYPAEPYGKLRLPFHRFEMFRPEIT